MNIRKIILYTVSILFVILLFFIIKSPTAFACSYPTPDDSCSSGTTICQGYDPGDGSCSYTGPCDCYTPTTCLGGASPGDWCETHFGPNFCCWPNGAPAPTGVCNRQMGYKYDSNCNCDTSGPGWDTGKPADEDHYCSMAPGTCGCPAAVVPTPTPIPACPTIDCSYPENDSDCASGTTICSGTGGSSCVWAGSGCSSCTCYTPPPAPVATPTPIPGCPASLPCSYSERNTACPGTQLMMCNGTGPAAINPLAGCTWINNCSTCSCIPPGPTPTPTPPPGSTPTPPPACTVIKATTNPPVISGNNVTLSWALGWTPGANSHAEYLNVSTSSTTNADGTLQNINEDNVVVTNPPNPTLYTKTYSPGTYYWNIVSDGCSPQQRKVSTPLGSFTVAPPLSVTCLPSPDRIAPGGNVTWTAYPLPIGSYTYLWSGTDSLAGKTGNPVQVSYLTVGTKLGTVTLTSGSTSITRACSNYVTVYGNSWMQVFGDVHSNK